MTDQPSGDHSYSLGESGKNGHHPLPANQASYDFSVVLGVKSFSPQSQHPPATSPSTTSYSHTPLEPSLCRSSSNSNQNNTRPSERPPGTMMSPAPASGRDQAPYIYSNVPIQPPPFGANMNVGFGLGEHPALGSQTTPSSFSNLGGAQSAPRFSHPPAASPVYHQPAFLDHVNPPYQAGQHEYIDDSWNFSFPNSQTTSPSRSTQDMIYSQINPPQTPTVNQSGVGSRGSTSFSSLIEHPQQRRNISLPSSSGPAAINVRAPPPYSAGRPSTSSPTHTSSAPWMSGSFDLSTGLFSKSSEHPRLRTAQACEKCRIRKAKCSGEHPSCQRCISRGLICEYAPERKMRGPNKPKPGKGKSLDDLVGSAPSTGNSDRSKGNPVKRRLSDVSRSDSKTFKVENGEDFRQREITGTNVKRKARQSSLHYDITSNVFRANDALGSPHIQDAHAMGTERKSVSQDSWAKNGDPEEMSWNWTTKFDQQIQDFATLSGFDATGGLRYPRMKECHSHSPSIASSISVDTTNIGGFGSGPPSDIGAAYERESSSEVSPTQSPLEYHMNEQGAGHMGMETHTTSSTAYNNIRHHRSPPPPLVHMPSLIRNITTANEAYAKQQEFSQRYNHHMRSGSGSVGTGTPTTSSGSPVTPASAESAMNTGSDRRERDAEMQLTGHVRPWTNGDENGDKNHRAQAESADHPR